MIQFDLKRRWLCFVTGLLLCGFGVALCTQAGLGTSPISSVPYVLSFIVPLTFGTWTLIFNALLLLLQVAILGRKFPKGQYLQLAAIGLFGLFIDLGMFVTRPLITDYYPLQLLMLFGGSAILAVGVALQVLSSVLFLPGDGLVKLIAARLERNFGPLKICFDISLVCLSLLISLLFLAAVEGIREGTVLAALLVGTFISLALPRLRFVKKFCYVRKAI